MLHTLDSAASLLSVSRRTVEREIASGRLAVVQIRGARRIDPAEIERYISMLTVTRAAPCPSTKTDMGRPG